MFCCIQFDFSTCTNRTFKNAEPLLLPILRRLLWRQWCKRRSPKLHLALCRKTSLSWKPFEFLLSALPNSNWRIAGSTRQTPTSFKMHHLLGTLVNVWKGLVRKFHSLQMLQLRGIEITFETYLWRFRRASRILLQFWLSRWRRVNQKTSQNEVSGLQKIPWFRIQFLLSFKKRARN